MKDTGDWVITVRSELGELIHKVNNRALKVWKEYGDSLFKFQILVPDKEGRPDCGRLG
jgi:enoyl reductase-like protein